MADSRILSYHDEVLYSSDLKILQSKSAFINDRIISFFFTHLSLSLSSPNSYFLSPPSLSYLLSLSPTPDILSPLKLDTKKVIFFPINDNDDPALPNGGSHWSLLVYVRKLNVFVHYDSMDGMNAKYAEKMYAGMRGFIGKAVGFLEGRIGRQENGYDCGLFVMEVARKVCEKCERGEEDEVLDFEEEVAGERVGRLRGEVLDLVLRLLGQKS